MKDLIFFSLFYWTHFKLVLFATTNYSSIRDYSSRCALNRGVGRKNDLSNERMHTMHWKGYFRPATRKQHKQTQNG